MSVKYTLLMGSSVRGDLSFRYVGQRRLVQFKEVVTHAAALSRAGSYYVKRSVPSAQKIASAEIVSENRSRPHRFYFDLLLICEMKNFDQRQVIS
jgi:hypothetical protein